MKYAGCRSTKRDASPAGGGKSAAQTACRRPSLEHPDPQRRRAAKVVTTQQRRAAVTHAQQSGAIPERRSCRFLGICRALWGLLGNRLQRHFFHGPIAWAPASGDTARVRAEPQRWWWRITDPGGGAVAQAGEFTVPQSCQGRRGGCLGRSSGSLISVGCSQLAD